jgi:hypothetical protein
MQIDRSTELGTILGWVESAALVSLDLNHYRRTQLLTLDL